MEVGSDGSRRETGAVVREGLMLTWPGQYSEFRTKENVQRYCQGGTARPAGGEE